MVVLVINSITDEEIAAEFLSVVVGVGTVVTSISDVVHVSQCISFAFNTNAAFAVRITRFAEINFLKHGIKYIDLSS